MCLLPESGKPGKPGMRLKELNDLVNSKPVDECVEWWGSFASSGYGQLSVNGVNRRASRVAYVLSTGNTLLEDEVVRHTCNNSKCVNPKHLVKGSQAQNQQDAVRSGRHSRQKLKPEDVLRLRQMREGGVPRKEVAKLFGITERQVARLANYHQQKCE